MRVSEFIPHPLIRSGHVQTLLSSRIVGSRLPAGTDFLSGANEVLIQCSGGVRLKAILNTREHTDPPGPLVIVVHGWLGQADSPYVLRAANALYRSGFSVARLLLRDHGDTTHLNEELFNSARIDEVVDACNWLIDKYSVAAGSIGAGIVGYSLGGNFAVRIAAHQRTSNLLRACLAVCPLVDPQHATDCLDRGLLVYRWYFLRKWRRAFVAKQSAFPERYDFSYALTLKSIGELTRHFVEHHSAFDNSEDYYAHYRLSQETLGSIRAATALLATQDDPVIPIRDFDRLRNTEAVRIHRLRYGGHCGLIKDLRLNTWLDPLLPDYFRRHLEAPG